MDSFFKEEDYTTGMRGFFFEEKTEMRGRKMYFFCGKNLASDGKIKVNFASNVEGM